ncbi:hypothetical protein EV715DRAFT_190295 [Schizophyllum commune]
MVTLPFDVLDTMLKNRLIGRRDLCRLAQTSKSWHSVASQLIWETLDGISPLLQLMPMDACRIEEIHSHSNLMTDFVFLRDLTEADWDPVYRYSTHVRHLTCDFRNVANFNSLYEPLVRCLPPRELFPSLRRLTLDPPEVDDVHAVPSFPDLLTALIPHSLTVLHISDSYLDVVDDISHIAKATPQIGSLHLQTLRTPSHEQRSQMIATPALLLHLFDVHWFGFYDPDLLLNLSQCAHLTSASLSFCVSSRCEFPPMPSPCFRSLRSLSISGLTLLDVARFLDSWGVRELREIEVELLGNAPSSADLHTFMVSLRDHCAHDTLQKISIMQLRDQPTTSLQGSHIHPLAGFSSLTYLRLDLLRGVQLSDQDYAQATRWWPRLKVCILTCPRFTKTWSGQQIAIVTPPATLETLTHFARNCTALRQLNIPLQACGVPYIDDDLQEMSHPLENLYLDPKIHVEEEEDAAREFVLRIFPNLGASSLF